MLCFVGALLYPFMSNSSLYHFFMAIIFSGIFVAVAQILFVYSLKLSTSGGTIMVLNTVNALFAYLLSVFRYNEPINFFSFLGIAIVVTCIVLVIR